MRLSTLSVLLALCAGLALSACTSSAPSGSFAAATPVATSVSLQTTGSTTAAAPGTVTPQPSGDYRIGSLDVLDVSVFQVPDLARTVQVSANGEISLPLIGSVVATGKTTAELQDEIAKKYSATYLQSPQVSVFVRDAQSQRVTINGEVNRPGVYPTPGPTTLIQVIATAGGVTDLADTTGVVILRQSGTTRTAAKFDVASIQAGKAPDPLVQGGDMIVVDRSGMKATFKNLRDTLPIFGAFRPLF
jgi:polysaccharide export outer membrane protein